MNEEQKNFEKKGAIITESTDPTGSDFDESCELLRKEKNIFGGISKNVETEIHRTKRVLIEQIEEDLLRTVNLPSIVRNDGYKRIIAWTSDLHTLSVYALSPRNFVTAEGDLLWLSKPQQILLDYYEKYIEKVNYYKVDTVCLVGDIIDGQNYRERGIMLKSTNLDDQVSAAVELLKPLCKGRRVFMWSGSGYHKSTQGHNPEKDICNHKDLAQVAESTHWMGPICNIQFPPAEKVFNVQHGVSSAYIYRTMLMDRESLFISEAESLMKIPHINVIVRGHWHNFIHIHKNRKHGIQLPCWEMYKPWKGALMSYGKMQPDIGGVITPIDEENRMDVWHYLFDVPRIVGDVHKG